jgi:hypothetical protein
VPAPEVPKLPVPLLAEEGDAVELALVLDPEAAAPLARALSPFGRVERELPRELLEPEGAVRPLSAAAGAPSGRGDSGRAPAAPRAEGAGVGGGGTLLTGTAVHSLAPETLCALIRVVLLAPFQGAILGGYMALHGAVDRHRALRGALPLAEFFGALRMCAAHDLRLLAQRLVETRDEGLVVACAGRIHAVAGTAGEVALIVFAVAFELGELGLALLYLTFTGGKCLRFATLVLIKHALRRLKLSGAGHYYLDSIQAGGFSASNDFSAVRLASKSTRCCMSCCRNCCICGQSAMAASMRGSLPRG